MNIIAFVLFFKRFLTRQFHQKVITGPSSENNWLFSSDIFPITFESKGISKSVAFGERPRWQKNKLSCYYYYIYLNKLTEVGGLVWSGLVCQQTWHSLSHCYDLLDLLKSLGNPTRLLLCFRTSLTSVSTIPKVKRFSNALTDIVSKITDFSIILCENILYV